LSDLFADIFPWLPWAVLGASLIGSTHCVSMCGGLVMAVAKTRSSKVAYHLGRLTGYMSLGALGGLLGSQFMFAEKGFQPWQQLTSWIASLILGLGLLAMGVRVWRGGAPHFSILPGNLFPRLFSWSKGSAAGAGLLTAFLPCGWLHTFVLGAVATQSPVRGALFLFMFWLGTLPALGLAPYLTERFLRPLSARAPRMAAIILITAGVVSIGAKVAPTFSSMPRATTEESAHCH
jgi:uncharacterized protein